MDILIKLPNRVDTEKAPEVSGMIDAKLAESGTDSKGIKIICDASDMEYISSAGLRVLLQAKKKTAGVSVINASENVCEIFEVTGFDEFINVAQRLEEVSIEGLELVGMGASSKVYRLDSDKVIKVYREEYSQEDVLKFQAITKKAIGLGVDTMISYGVAKVGKSFGAIYELLDAKSVLDWIKEDPANEKKYLKMFVDFVKRNHEIEIDDSDVKSIKKVFYDRIDRLSETGFYSLDEAMTARQIIYSIPDKNTFVHGDCHIGNILLSKQNELYFIDLPTISKGNPIFDLFGMAWMRIASEVLDDEKLEELVGVRAEDLERAWKEILAFYFETEDKAIIDELDRQYTALECLNLSMAETFAPGLFTAETLEWLKAEGLKASELEF